MILASESLFPHSLVETPFILIFLRIVDVEQNYVQYTCRVAL